MEAEPSWGKLRVKVNNERGKTHFKDHLLIWLRTQEIPVSAVIEKVAPNPPISWMAGTLSDIVFPQRNWPIQRCQ